MNITVETADLRLALKAVAPHADPDKDFPQLHRVRLDVGPENLTVSATNRYTVGHALVSIWDQGDGELGPFDLSPTDCKEILTLFPGTRGDDDQPGATVRLEVDSEHVTVTDISGLFQGKSLVLPRYPMEDHFPAVQQLIAAKLDGKGQAAERLITSGQMLNLFMRASQAYGQPLVIDPAGEAGVMLITCGESFVGLLMPQRPDEDTTARIKGWHLAWLQRIADRAPELTS